jgi:hypothetical protein
MLEAQAPKGSAPDPFEHEQRAAEAAARDGRNGHSSDEQVIVPPEPPTTE